MIQKLHSESQAILVVIEAPTSKGSGSHPKKGHLISVPHITHIESPYILPIYLIIVPITWRRAPC